MLKLREPFSQKIHLHIKQDMLQGLWEKYVPASSPGYEQIQLIYLDQQYGPEEEQPKQIQLLIRLVLQNRMMQMGLEKYPSSLAYGVKRMEHSLHRVEKYYLTQLRSSNFGMFRTLNRYMTALEQEELANRRYSGWKKEHAAIEKQWEEYRLLSLFSVQVKEFLEERSRQMPRTLERKLFASLPEAEYQALAEESVWQEKDKLIAYLRTCDETQRRQIVEHLKKETELCRTLALKTGISETGRKEKRDIREKDLGERFAKDRFSKLKFSGKRYAKIKPEKEEATIGQILKSVPGQSMGERLAKAAELFDRKEFWLFCRKAVDLETADCQMVIWKRNREEMISYISQADTEQLQKLLAQLDTVYSEKMIRLQKQHSQELIRDFREHIAAMAKEEPFERIADMVYPEEPFEEIADMVYSAEPGNQTDKGTAENPPVEYVFEESGGQRSSGGIHRFVQKIEQTQEIWKERIRQREAQAFETYGDLYREALKDKISKIRQEDIESLVEDTFRNQQKENIYQENITEEEVRNICEWGRIFLESIGTENPVEAANGESLLAEHQGETQHTENPAEDAGRGLIPAEPEYQEELVYLFEKVGRQMESQNIQRETDVLAISRRLEEGKAESLKKLLGHIHTLEEGQKEEFTTWLAEAVIIWRQVYAARESLGKITADVMDVLRQEGLQNAAGQEEAGHLVKEAFLRRHKESIYREQVAEEEIRSICEWGRVFLESVDTVRREKAADAGRQEKVTDTEYPSEARYTEYPAEAAGRGFLLTEPEHPAEAQYTENPAEDAGRGFLPAEPEYQEELVYLFEKVGRQMESQNIHRETTDVLAISRRLEEGKAESLKKLLGHIHTLEEGQKEEFTTWLAEAVIIWRQVYAARESLGKITVDVMDVPGQAYTAGEPLGGRIAGVMDVPGQEGLQKAIGQEEAGHLVEEAFLRRHKESVYQEHMTEEEIRSVCEWGRVFLESVDTAYRTEISDTGQNMESQMKDSERLEQKEELIHLIRQINQHIEEKSIHGENLTLSWQESQLEEEKTENLLTHIHELKEEERTEFVRKLADAVLIWRQMDILARSFKETSADAFSALEQEAFPVIAGQEAEEQSADAVLIPQPAQEEELWPAESEKTGVPYQELWEWGEALLFHPEQEWEDGDILPVQRQEELSFSQDGSQEDMQTQIIRRQIEAAKDRNSLQRLVMQINHQIESGQEAQGIKESLQMQEPFLLVYTDSQLQASPIQRLVSHIRTLDEEQYGILVEELSRITKLQWLSHSRQEGIAKASDKQEGIAKASDKQEGIAKASDRQEGIAKASDKQKEMSLRTEENLPDAVLEHLDHKDEQEVFGKALPIGHKQVGKLAAAYPGLAWRIQEYERQRRRMVRQHIQELTQYPSYESGGRMPQGSGNRQEDALLEGLLSGSYRKRSGELPDGLPSGNYLEGSGELQQELRHFIQKNDASDENQQKTEMRMRQEAIQIKSAQEQLDRKLKEVEEELKKVESSAKAKEDVNVLAEQVKKQLYEELHVERLRRGLA